MSRRPQNSIFALLQRVADGDDSSRAALGEAVFTRLTELRRPIPAASPTEDPASEEPAGSTRPCADRCSPHRTVTELIHALYQETFEGNGETRPYRHLFFSTVTRTMRQMLRATTVDPAPEAASPDLAATLPVTRAELALLDRSLERLREDDPRASDVVAFRCFLGLEAPDIAWILDVSESEVENEWRAGRLWLAEAARGPEERSDG